MGSGPGQRVARLAQGVGGRGRRRHAVAFLAYGIRIAMGSVWDGVGLVVPVTVTEVTV